MNDEKRSKNTAYWTIFIPSHQKCEPSQQKCDGSMEMNILRGGG